MVQCKSQRVSEVVEIGKRIDQFKQIIESEKDKLEAYWTQYQKLQADFILFLAQIVGGAPLEEKEPSEGYRVDMRLLDAEHATEIQALLEEVDEVGHEAIKKMKASEKVYYTHFIPLYRQGTDGIFSRKLTSKRTK